MKNKNENENNAQLTFFGKAKSIMFPPNQITFAESMGAVSQKIQTRISYLFPQPPLKDQSLQTPEQQHADNMRALLQHLTFT